jgi:hypothetical protein
MISSSRDAGAIPACCDSILRLNVRSLHATIWQDTLRAAGGFENDISGPGLKQTPYPRSGDLTGNMRGR